MQYYCFVLIPDVDTDEVWEQLSRAGYQLLYAVEEPNKPSKIFGYMPIGNVKPHPSIAAIFPCTFNGIDWQLQWSKTSGTDREGTVKININEYLPGCSSQLLIYPGPGFGDLSHPTTKQALRLMVDCVQGKFVLDVGCGSGILGLAAAQMGAVGVHGIDIDKEALAHAQLNARHNKLAVPVTFGLPEESFEVPEKAGLLIVMNMISSEQETAWSALTRWHNHHMDIITSGILLEQQRAYLKSCSLKGWNLIQKSSLKRWLAFHFRT